MFSRKRAHEKINFGILLSSALEYLSQLELKVVKANFPFLRLCTFIHRHQDTYTYAYESGKFMPKCLGVKTINWFQFSWAEKFSILFCAQSLCFIVFGSSFCTQKRALNAKIAMNMNERASNEMFLFAQLIDSNGVGCSFQDSVAL